MRSRALGPADMRGRASGSFARLHAWFLPWRHRALIGVALLAAFCNFFQLSRNGYANLYYSAAVKSMSESWRNFFFVSFDPGGYVTVDKPPLGFWIQTLSVKLFGYSSLSILLPEALAGVLSVLVLYALVKRVFGPAAGLLAALALALTPISVVTDRNNTIDSLLVLTVLLAAWAVVIAAERASLGWLLLGAALVGVGFNIKMLEAYLVVPALTLVYLLGVRLPWRTRVWHLALAGVVLVVLSFSWITIVDLIPASQRPYVGSSQTNSELELALGYNGVRRITGIFNFVGGARGGGARAGASSNNGAFSAGETGAPGPLRLFNDALGGQISWLLPLALFGLLASGWGVWNWRLTQAGGGLRAAFSRWRDQPEARRNAAFGRRGTAFVLWGMWLLTMGAFFSVAQFFHTYYMSMLAPGVAALAGIGATLLWSEYRRPGWRGWLLPLSLVVTALVQARLLSAYPDYSRWLTPIIVIVSFVAAGALVWARLPQSSTVGSGYAWLRERRAVLVGLTAVGLVALLLAPVAWDAASLGRASGSIPSAGPGGRNTFAFAGAGNATLQREFEASAREAGIPTGDLPPGGPGGDGGIQVNAGLLRYLEANQGNATYLFATTNANTAAPYIIETGKPVMAIGGFLGSDPILTQSQLKQLVARGQVRYFLLQGGGGNLGASSRFPDAPNGGFPDGPAGSDREPGNNAGGFGGFGGRGFGANASLTSWVTQSCRVVPASAYGSATSQSATAGRGFAGGGQLYDCAAYGASATPASASAVTAGAGA